MVPLFWTTSLSLYLKDKVSGVDQMLWCVYDMVTFKTYNVTEIEVALYYYVALYRTLEKTHAQIYDIEFFF